MIGYTRDSLRPEYTTSALFPESCPQATATARTGNTVAANKAAILNADVGRVVFPTRFRNFVGTIKCLRRDFTTVLPSLRGLKVYLKGKVRKLGGQLFGIADPPLMPGILTAVQVWTISRGIFHCL